MLNDMYDDRGWVWHTALRLSRDEMRELTNEEWYIELRTV